MMETSNMFFQAVFLVTFCAMIIDGHMDPREIALNQEVYENNSMQPPVDYKAMTNHHINIVNQDVKGLFQGYFLALKDQELSKEQSVDLLYAIESVITVDGKVTKEEQQFLKLTQSQLGISSAEIKAQHPRRDSLSRENGNLNFLKPKEISAFVETLKLPILDPLKRSNDGN